MGRDNIVSLLDYSQRNSNKGGVNTIQQVNPYIWEINSSKKGTKKKSESIDLQSKRGSSLKPGSYLRHS